MMRLSYCELSHPFAVHEVAKVYYHALHIALYREGANVSYRLDILCRKVTTPRPLRRVTMSQMYRGDQFYDFPLVVPL